MAARKPKPRGALRLGLRALPLVLALALPSPRPAAAETAGTAERPPRDETGPEFGLGVLGGATQVREDLIAPLRWVGPSFGITTSQAYRGERWDEGARLRLAAAYVSERYGSPNLLMLPALDLSVHFGSGGRPGRVDVGAWAGIHQLLGWYASWDDAHLYWFSTTGLGPSVRLTLDTLPRPVELELHAPVVALVSRPPRRRYYKVDNLVNLGFWLGRFADEPELTSVHELQAASLRATFRGSRGSFRVDPWLELEAETFSKPERVAHVTLWLGAEGRWGL